VPSLDTADVIDGLDGLLDVLLAQVIDVVWEQVEGVADPRAVRAGQGAGEGRRQRL